MDTEHLKQSLQRLHASLEAAPAVDPELGRLLQMLEQDIEALLERRNQAARQQPQLLKPPVAPELPPAEAALTPPVPMAPDPELLLERAQEISARFAIRYPHVDSALRELAQILARIGI